MAYFRCLSNRSNFLTRRCHPSIGYVLHPGDDRKHDPIDRAPSLQGISDMVQQRGFASGFPNSSLLGSLRDKRCVDFAFSSTAGAAFCRHMSTSSGGENIELLSDVAEALSDTTVLAAASQAPAVNEVAIAAADSFAPIALLQHCVDYIHKFSGLEWWASIVLTTFFIRLAVLPLVINQLKATSKLTLMRPHLEAIKQKIQDGDVDMVDGNRQMQRLFKEYGVSPFTPMKGLFIQGPIFICFFLAITNMAEKVPSFRTGGASWFLDLSTPDPLYILPALTGITFWITVECNMQEGLEGNPIAGTMKKISRVMAVATIPLTMGFPKAIFCYWITSNVFSLGYGLALKYPAVKRFLGIPEIPETPPAPTDGGSQPSFSLSSIMKQFSEASQNASRSSLPVEPPPKVADDRIRANAVMSQRIRSLEKQVKGRKRSKKR